jgi:hypothetical protein
MWSHGDTFNVVQHGKTAKVLLPFPRGIREAVHNKMRLRSRDQASDVDSEQIRRRYFLLPP